MSAAMELRSLVQAVKRTGGISEKCLMEELVPLVEKVLNGDGESMRTVKVENVVTLDEAQERSGRSRQYFIYGGNEPGGLSRLEAWEKEGYARKAGRVWLISAHKIDTQPSGDGTIVGKIDAKDVAATRSGFDQNGLFERMVGR